MNRRRRIGEAMSHCWSFLRSAGVASLLGFALAKPAAAATAPRLSVAPPGVTQAASPKRSHAHAWLRVELGRGSSWLGQAVPITLTAHFRDVEGVTLEGVPALKSDAIFTSTLGSQPRQATEIIDGTPGLVATWTGTLTPAAAGPLALSVELPVRVRYHDPAPQRVDQPPAPSEDPFAGMDPFDGMNGLIDIDPLDPGSMQRIFRNFQRTFDQPLGAELVGRAHDDALTLKVSAATLDVKPLPSAGQPAGFSGAVGRFQLDATLSTNAVRASEPLTLTVVATGDGDMDRVQLAGVASSADFKTYPLSSKTEPPVAGHKLGRKVFEQVLIPLHGGELTVPPLALSTFDPVTSTYTTVTTAPLPVAVEGQPASAAIAAAPLGSNPVPLRAESGPEPTLPAPPSSQLVPRLEQLALGFLPLAGLWLAAAVWRLRARGDREKALQKAVRRAAKQGSSAAFFAAARQLIVYHFARRWRVAEEAVTATELATKLGSRAEPLVSALSTADAVRFGRGDLGASNLSALCSQLEATLKEDHHAHN